jgi:PTS system galactosamine-specific IIC component
MDITLLQGILLAILAFVVAIDLNLEGFFIFRPIIVCTLAGAILGDLKTGLMAGGLAELSFAGLTPVGGTVPPDAVMTSIMTVVIAVTTNQNVATALAIAIPFGLLMQYLVSILFSVYSFANPVVDRYARKGEVEKIVRLGLIMVFVYSLIYAIVAFLSSYVAQDAMSTVVNSMPQFLIHGFQIAGGLIPAVGFALLLNVMLKNRYLGYLLAGFVFVCFIPFGNVLPAAVMGLSFALIDYYRSANNTEDKDEKGAVTNEGI